MKSIAELKKDFQSKTTPDNIVEAVIFQIYKNANSYKIPKTQAIFQTAFFKMKKENPGLFSDFLFDESGITPFSDELYSVLFRLETSKVLHSLNPGYESYTIADSLGLLEASYKKLESKKTEIDKCAEIFSELIEMQAN